MAFQTTGTSPSVRTCPVLLPGRRQVVWIRNHKKCDVVFFLVFEDIVGEWTHAQVRMMDRPVSSSSSRRAHASMDSPYSRWPPGNCQVPAPWAFLRFPRSTRPSRTTMTATPIYGLFSSFMGSGFMEFRVQGSGFRVQGSKPLNRFEPRTYEPVNGCLFSDRVQNHQASCHLSRQALELVRRYWSGNGWTHIF